MSISCYDQRDLEEIRSELLALPLPPEVHEVVAVCVVLLDRVAILQEDVKNLQEERHGS